MNKKIIRGIVGYALNRWSIRIVSIISTIFVARMLGPEAFGQSAIIISSILLFDIFFSFSFDNAIIQSSNQNQKDYNIAWTYTRLIKGTFVFILLQIIISFLSFKNINYGSEELLRVSATYVLIHAFFNTAFIREIQNLNFLKDVVQTIIPGLARPLFAILLAYYLQDVRAILYAWLIQAILVVFLSHALTKYRIALDFRLNDLKDYFSFSLSAYFISIVQRTREVIDTIFIINILGNTLGGYYQVGKRVSGETVGDIKAIIEKVLFPMYSLIKDDFNLVIDTQKKTLVVTSLITLYIIVFLFLKIELIISILLGEKWMDAYLICQFILVASYFTNISGSLMTLYKSLNMQVIEIKTRIIEIFIIMAGCFLVGKDYGFIGIGSVLILASFIGFIYNFYCYHFYVKRDLLSLIFALIPGIIFSTILYLSITLFDIVFQNIFISELVLLFIYFSIAISVFLTLFIILFYFKTNFFGLNVRKVYELCREQFNLE